MFTSFLTHRIGPPTLFSSEGENGGVQESLFPLFLSDSPWDSLFKPWLSHVTERSSECIRCYFIPRPDKLKTSWQMVKVMDRSISKGNQKISHREVTMIHLHTYLQVDITSVGFLCVSVSHCGPMLHVILSLVSFWSHFRDIWLI